MAVPDDEVDGFLSPKEERERDEAEKGKVCLPKFVPPQPFDGTMKETKSLVVDVGVVTVGGDGAMVAVEGQGREGVVALWSQCGWQY